MSENANPLWFVLLVCVIYLVPIAAATELMAALFSKRVRGYIAKHSVAHALWFASALFLALLLIPAHNTPARQTGESEATDGLYLESSKSSTGVVLRVPHPTDGRIFTIPVEPFDGFVPARIEVFDTPEGSCVQVDGSKDCRWMV
jgi:hypothetical protein